MFRPAVDTDQKWATVDTKQTDSQGRGWTRQYGTSVWPEFPTETMGISNQPKGLATKYQQERLQLTRQAQAQDERNETLRMQ